MKRYPSYSFLVYTNGLKFDKTNSTVTTRRFENAPCVSSRKAELWTGENELEVGNKIKEIHGITCPCSNDATSTSPISPSWIRCIASHIRRICCMVSGDGGTASASDNLAFFGFGNMFDVDYDMGNSQTGNLLYYCSDCSNYTEICITPPKTYRTKRGEQNIQYLVCEKDKESLRTFIPTLVAPIDFDKDKKTKEQYWLQAKENCYIWNECESSIYNDKAYFCIVAAAMDHLFYDNKHGWEVDQDKNPMDRDDQQIKEQAVNFCYRCGFCSGNRKDIDAIAGQKQLACNKTLCSNTNFVDIQELKKIERFNP
jgi:hypothetical protein